MAAQIPGVEYVIVYDNEVSEWLVPMSSESPSTMSLLFVSYRSGLGKKEGHIENLC